MRAARILLPLLVALLAAACARQQPSYYLVDPATGQPQASSYGQQAYAQAYTQPQAQASDDHRGLFSANRGLFARRQNTSAYAQQTYSQPSSSQRGVVQQRAYGPQSYVLQYHPPRATEAYASAAYGYDAYAPAKQAYTLGPGDKLRVVVFGQQGISGDYMVDASGKVSLPLIGPVQARGFTTQQLAATIADRLKQGYVREPHVTVDIAAYRPFFILGEVTNPGQYPYVPNMTAENAIAIAGGFAPRANKREVVLTRNAGNQHYKGEVPLNYPLRPGDTLLVKERWF